MKNKFLLFLMLGITLFAACNDDDDQDVPPTLAEIAGDYSGDKLVATIDNAAAGETAAVQLSRVSDTTATLVLKNIVPNHESFEISKAKFASLSRSNFYSRLTGEATSEAGDLKVAATAEIADGVMTLTVTTTEIENTATSPEDFYDKSYSGNMTITVANMPADPIPQTVKITAPTNGESTSINLLIEDFSFDIMSLGEIKLENVELTESENGYTFSQEDITLTLPMVNEVTIDATGTINSNTLQLNLNISAMGGMLTVGVEFDGEVDAE